MRLRQVALAARDLDVASEVLHGLGLNEPFHDPIVGQFGLINAVYALGDTFLEIVVPNQSGTTAGRWLDRIDPASARSLIGYMVLIQVDDLDVARARAEELSVRTVWQAETPELRACHLHPKDLGAIVSIEQALPPESWLWGGPNWTEGSVAGSLRAVEVGTTADPQTWARLLARPVVNDAIALDDGTEIRFVEGAGVLAVELDIGGRRVRLGS